MTEHKNIYMALAAAQSEFGQVTKGSTNPAFKSKYADLSDVASVVIPTLNRHGCAVLHYMADGAMRTEFVHGASETKVACDIPLIVEKNNMQGMKSATTYAKRIGLESLSGIAPEDDDGNAAAEAPPKAKEPEQRRAPAPGITGSQLDQIKALIPLQKTVSVVDIMRKYQAAAKERGQHVPQDFDQLTAKQGDAIIARLNEIIDEERIAAATGNPQHDKILADEVPY